jgi:hypothetical protein
MNKVVYKLLIAAVVALSVGTQELPAQVDCAPNWTANDYKSFSDIQSEIEAKYGKVKILRVALCSPGGNAYFQIVILSGQGEVQRIQLAASN